MSERLDAAWAALRDEVIRNSAIDSVIARHRPRIEAEARADALDVDALAEAMDTCFPSEFSDHKPGNKVRAKAVAAEYRAILAARKL